MWWLLLFTPLLLLPLCAKNKVVSQSMTLRNSKNEHLKSSDTSKVEDSRKSKETSKEKELSQMSKEKDDKSEITDPDHPEEVITKRKERKKKEGEDNRTAWTRYTLERPCRRLAKQFKKLKAFVPLDSDGKAMKTTTHDANVLKNRYTDVACLDATRVVLKNRENDYIHASWFTLPNASTKFICAQGPLKETIEDFWALVYQEKTKMIVMLCPLVEGNSEKCALYWPVKKGDVAKYGDYTVTQVEMRPEPFEGVCLTYFDVQYKKEEPFRVWHVLVTWWPDQLAPNDARPMLELHRWVLKNNPKDRPILVHCSAGVGRTATFVGLDYAIQRIQEDCSLGMLDIVKEMRKMRQQSVQSHVQYIFLHVLVFEQFVKDGVVTKDETMTKFVDDYVRNANKRLKKRKEDDQAKQAAEIQRRNTRDVVEE